MFPTKSLPAKPQTTAMFWEDSQGVRNSSTLSTDSIKTQRAIAAVDLARENEIPGLKVSKSRMFPTPQTQRPTPGEDSYEVGQVPGLRVPNLTTLKAVGTAVPPAPPTSAPLSSGFHLHSNSQSMVSPVTPASLNPKLITPNQESASTCIPRIPPLALLTAANGSKDVSRGSKEWLEDGRDQCGVQRKNNSPNQEMAMELGRTIKELDAAKKELEEERRLRIEVKRLLELERQRKEEAEIALSDVRRECRQPFVVPSLLDTFVELSKLTTRGLKVSGSKVLANPVSDYSSPQHLGDVGDVLVVNVLSHREATPGTQRTEAKLEPLDGTLVL